ncbi:MAG: hypothetical protein PHT04_02895 [Eubacteriales bacterium]|nr:hypothetical protein [Eubacteriales bacterium]
MVNLNDRLNEIMRRLEAATAEANQSVYQTQPKPEAFYDRAEEMPASADEIAGPGDLAETIRQQEQMQIRQARDQRPCDIRNSEKTSRLGSIKGDQLVQGIILAEILGKPVAKRRYRGRQSF